MSIDNPLDEEVFSYPSPIEGKDYALIGKPGVDTEAAGRDFVNQTYQSYEEVIQALERLRERGVVAIQGTHRTYTIDKYIEGVRSFQAGERSLNQFTRNINLRTMLRAISEGKPYIPD